VRACQCEETGGFSERFLWKEPCSVRANQICKGKSRGERMYLRVCGRIGGVSTLSVDKKPKNKKKKESISRLKDPKKSIDSNRLI